MWIVYLLTFLLDIVVIVRPLFISEYVPTTFILHGSEGPSVKSRINIPVFLFCLQGEEKYKERQRQFDYVCTTVILE